MTVLNESFSALLSAEQALYGDFPPAVVTASTKKSLITQATGDHAGHRKRVKEKFLQHGAEAMADYELLELALFYFIPQKDVKPLAKALLQKFGGLNETLYAEPRLLQEFPDVKESTITGFKLLTAMAERLNKVKIRNVSVLDRYQTLCDYVRTKIGFASREEFHVLFLNRQSALIADEIIHTGTIDRSAVYPREIMKRALFHSAAGFAIAHNHPSGSLEPSPADIAVTKQIISAASVMDMFVLDHLIVSKNGVFSFRKEGLMP
jgi:DNA repair protein RadC